MECAAFDLPRIIVDGSTQFFQIVRLTCVHFLEQFQVSAENRELLCDVKLLALVITGTPRMNNVVCLHQWK